MAEKKIAKDQRTCVVCGKKFQYIADQTPSTCGAVFCEAVDEWDDERWESFLRMVEARQASPHMIKIVNDPDAKDGWRAVRVPMELTDIDREALRRRDVAR